MNDIQIKKPAISVIIPTRNRLGLLKRVLTALEKQSLNTSFFQVIIIDDGSTDGTEAFLNIYQEIADINVRYTYKELHNAGIARNEAVSQADGEILLFLDSDLIPQENVVEKHLNFHTKQKGDLNVLLGEVKVDRQLINATQARLSNWSLKNHKNKIQQVDWWKYHTGNTSIYKKLFNKVGGFSREFSGATLEDTELGYRMFKQGACFYYDPSILTIHHHPMGAREFFLKGKDYGENVAKWYSKTPELRYDLTKRYGVFAQETSLTQKAKYLLRFMLVNKYTVPFIFEFGRLIRKKWLNISDRIYQCIYRYYLRRSFRNQLKQSQRMNHKSFIY
jgi:glycosyltransferase involved in cell wall biosynthesis